ncbi:MAG: SDR family oxidoreductase [Rhodoferax sp.]|nr:SDR family oxidoreductase [Rhodoferax sp.]MCF8210431.1 SDR family oxidoreductase [Rhodoferax sp.]
MPAQRVAVITGGASGLGYAAARRFLSEGMRVALWDISDPNLQRATAELAQFGDVWGCQTDVSDVYSIEQAAQRTRDVFGDADTVLAAAGIAGHVLPYVDYPLSGWHDVINTNLTGVHLTCRALVPTMIASGWGRVITVSSMAGKEGNPKQIAYSSAKAAIMGFTKSLGKELAQTGVLVNGIAPTLVQSPMLDEASVLDPQAIDALRAKIPMGRLGRPEEFAALAAWLASDQCSFTTGMTFDLSGGRSTY